MYGCLLKIALDAWLPAPGCLGFMVDCSSLLLMLGFLLKVTMDAWFPAQGYLGCLVACSVYGVPSKIIRQIIGRNFKNIN
jgi:hypothetical protein